MMIEKYPPQEPFSDFGRAYRDECLRLSEGIVGEEYVYGSDHPSQGLTVFPATEPTGAVLLFLHGGGWTNGYKEEMGFLAPSFNHFGISLVSIGYRLAPEFVFPDNVNDVADAVAKVVQLSGRYGIDRRKIFLGGHSAGGHLSSLLAVRNDWQESRGLPVDILRGCLPVSGSYDFTPGAGFSGRPRFLGETGPHNEVKASPIFAMKTASVPFLMTYGTNDFPHLIVQAQKFEAVYSAAGGDVQLYELPQTDHMTVITSSSSTDSAWVKQAAAWMGTVA